jgi:hypothetical protein
VEKTQIQFSLHNQAAVSKDNEEESKEQTETEGEDIGSTDDPSEELEQLAPEELLRVHVRVRVQVYVLPGDLEKAECTCRAEQSWSHLTLLLLLLY